VATRTAGSARAAAAEVAAFVALLLSYIWLWKGTFPGDRVAVVALYFAIGLETHLRRGERPDEIGLRLDTFGAACGMAMRWLAPAIVAGLAAGRLLGGWAFPPPPRAAADLAYSAAWGTLQQYGLACVLYRRLREALPGRLAPMLAAAGLFSILHLPNPLLMGVTLALGILACAIYERHPNLWALGLAHGLASFCLANALPGWLTLDWRVGPQVLPRVLAWF